MKQLKLSVYFCFLAITNTVSGLDFGIGWGARIDISPIDIAVLSSIASCVYFDATYLQSSIGYRLQRVDDVGGTAAELYELHDRPVAIPVQYLTWFDMVLLFKYPFTFGRFVFYPQAGVEFAPNLRYIDQDGNDLKNLTYVDDEGNETVDSLSTEELRHLNLFYIEGGVGMDFIAYIDERTNTRWYFRIETIAKYNPFLNSFVFSANVLYGCILPPKNQNLDKNRQPARY